MTPTNQNGTTDTRGTIDQWVETLSNANKKLGLQTILVFIGLGFFTGIIPSALTQSHEEIQKMLGQNQVLLTGQYAFRYAECLNKGEADAGSNQGLWNRAYTRCTQARDDANSFMKSLGVKMIELLPESTVK